MSNTNRHKTKARIKRGVEPWPDGPKHFTKRLGSPLQVCNCRKCRYGIKKGNNAAMVRTMIRSHRQATKRILKTGDIEGLTNTIQVGYTD